MSDFVNRKIRELGTDMLDGSIGLNPYEQNGAGACTYCAYSSVCGFDKRLGSRLVRRLEDMSQETALERIKEEVNGG